MLGGISFSLAASPPLRLALVVRHFWFPRLPAACAPAALVGLWLSYIHRQIIHGGLLTVHHGAVLNVMSERRRCLRSVLFCV